MVSKISGLPMPPSIWFQTCPWLGLMKTPLPRMAGVDDLEVALDVGPGGGVENRAAVRVEDDAKSPARTSINCQVLPVFSLRQMPPVGPLRAA